MTNRDLDSTSKLLRPLAEYTERLPSSRRGKRLNRATLWRWALKGFPDGRYLHTVGLGAGRFTCDAWVSEFLTSPRPRKSTRPLGSAIDASELERIRARLKSKEERKLE